MSDERKVFDLDSFAPKPIYFKLGNVVYELPGDPDVEVVAQMLRLERSIKGGDPEDGDEPIELREAIVEGRDLIVDLLVEAGNDIPDDFRIGTLELLMLFALVTGGETVAIAVANAITDGMASEGENGKGRNGSVGADGEGGAGATPTRSRKRSSARSSRSASRAAGRRTTTAP